MTDEELAAIERLWSVAPTSIRSGMGPTFGALLTEVKRLRAQLLDRTAERDAHRTGDSAELAAERFYRELHVLAVELGVPADVPSLECGERALTALRELKARARDDRTDICANPSCGHYRAHHGRRDANRRPHGCSGDCFCPAFVERTEAR